MQPRRAGQESADLLCLSDCDWVLCQSLMLWWAVDTDTGVFFVWTWVFLSQLCLYEQRRMMSHVMLGMRKNCQKLNVVLTFAVLHLKTFLTTKAFLAPVFIGQSLNVVMLEAGLVSQCCANNWSFLTQMLLKSVNNRAGGRIFSGFVSRIFFTNMFIWLCQLKLKFV